MTIFKEQVEAVLRNADDYRLAEAYYDGEVNETLSDFGSGKLRNALARTRHNGQHNYCRVIVDAVLHRTEIAGIIANKATAQRKVDAVWKANELDLEANEVHRRALEYGDAYVMVWPDENGELLISVNSPRTTAMVYDPENPRKKLYAVKIWKHEENKIRMNVYTKDAIHKYYSNTSEYTEGTNWISMGSEDNPFNEIPVFHFRTSRPYGRPEHVQAFGVQNDINKLLATHMFTVDYQGAPQRYALAANESDGLDFNDEDDDKRNNVSGLRSTPGNLWYLKGVSQVGEFKPVDPKVFWEPISKLKQSMAALTDTPYHLLERDITPPSGDALRISEAPLMKKVKDRQTSFAVTWTEIFTFILKVEGISESDLDVKWNVVESMDELNEWDINIKKINAGMSKRQVFREQGYSDEEIDRVFAEVAAEARAKQAYSPTNPVTQTSTTDNQNFGNTNGLTEAARTNGGHPTPANTATPDAATKSTKGQVNN